MREKKRERKLFCCGRYPSREAYILNKPQNIETHCHKVDLNFKLKLIHLIQEMERSAMKTKTEHTTNYTTNILQIISVGKLHVLIYKVGKRIREIMTKEIYFMTTQNDEIAGTKLSTKTKCFVQINFLKR